MGNHFISVSIFCFLCATHSPCESHIETHRSGPTSNRTTADRLLSLTESDATSSERERDKNNILGTDFLPFNLFIKRNNSSNKASFNARLKRNASDLSKIDESVGRNAGSEVRSERTEDTYVRKLFEKYGDGESMSMEGFERLIRQIDAVAQLWHADRIDPVLSLERLAAFISQETENNMTDYNLTCLNHRELLESVRGTSTDTKPSDNSNNNLDADKLMKICPALLYGVTSASCEPAHPVSAPDSLNEPASEQSRSIDAAVWLYSLLAVVLISACGVLGLAVIPVMQKRYYQPLLQFLVALAVGTLAGDALLHLLPHAMSESESEDAHERSRHDENMWKGFVAMLGLVLFFVVERVILLVAKWRKERQLREKVPKMKVVKEGLQPPTAGEKQCKHKYSSIPYCYDAIAMIDKNHVKDGYPVFRLLPGGDELVQSSASTTFLDPAPDSTEHPRLAGKCTHHHTDPEETNQNMTACPNEQDRQPNNASACSEVNKMLLASDKPEDEQPNGVEYTVILREHESRHHGHTHAHGHVHAPPNSMSSVAWMVILGDGLHNFTDGMAIGAAFSGSIAGGFSTAVAVLCHELPHELGDFAVLLKAGMSMRQALFYNLLSSVLCLLGNVFGVWLGNVEYASSWVFAVAAGTFIYIALVDMMPELSNGHEEDDGMLFQCFLQLAGLLGGFGIMTFIALYEHDLKHIFREQL